MVRDNASEKLPPPDRIQQFGILNNILTTASQLDVKGLIEVERAALLALSRAKDTLPPWGPEETIEFANYLGTRQAPDSANKPPEKIPLSPQPPPAVEVIAPDVITPPKNTVTENLTPAAETSSLLETIKDKFPTLVPVLEGLHRHYLATGEIIFAGETGYEAGRLFVRNPEVRQETASILAEHAKFVFLESFQGGGILAFKDLSLALSVLDNGSYVYGNTLSNALLGTPQQEDLDARVLFGEIVAQSPEFRQLITDMDVYLRPSGRQLIATAIVEYVYLQQRQLLTRQGQSGEYRTEVPREHLLICPDGRGRIIVLHNVGLEVYAKNRRTAALRVIQLDNSEAADRVVNLLLTNPATVLAAAAEWGVCRLEEIPPNVSVAYQSDPFAKYLRFTEDSSEVATLKKILIQ